MSEQSPPTDDWQKWFESIWEDREERLYPAFFGTMTGPGIYPIPQSTFASLGTPDVDPRFLTHGVLEFGPNELHDDTIYVSSGMSNAWGETPETVRLDQYSGLGFEFVVHARERATWPIKLLHWVMAVQILMACGRLEGELLQPNDRIPLGGSLAKKDGLLTAVLVTTPDAPGQSGVAKPLNYPARFGLKSGMVDLLILVGITEKEREFAKSQGVEGLVTLLRHQGVWPVTDPGRVSLV